LASCPEADAPQGLESKRYRPKPVGKTAPESGRRQRAAPAAIAKNGDARAIAGGLAS